MGRGWCGRTVIVGVTPGLMAGRALNCSVWIRSGGQAVIAQVTAEGVHEGGRPAEIAVSVGGHAQDRE